MKKICPDCFREIGNYDICPHCGFYLPSDKRELYHLPLGTVLDHRYILGRVVGFGGFGITYKAYDTKLSIPVAIKEFYPSGLVTRSPGACALIVFSGNEEKEKAFRSSYNRFIEEARTMAKFREHPHIVNVFGYFPANNTAYIVMEFLDGINLKEYIEAQGGKMSYEDTVAVINPIMDALEAIHKEKIIHRDISPDNIFITVDNKVKLMDFGAARLSSGESESTLTVVLKPGYAPPEQYQTKSKQGPWTDIYALGATIYKALTGGVPDESTDRVVNDELKKPSLMGVKLPLNAEKSVMKAMALKPGLRFQKISEMRLAFSDRKTIYFPEVEYKKRRKRRAVSMVSVFTGIVLIVVGAFLYTTNNTVSPQYIDEDTITVWAVEEQSDMENMIAGFMGISENSDYNVEVKYIPESEYESRLVNAVGTEEFPDVFRGDLVSASFREEHGTDVGLFYRYFDMKDYYLLGANKDMLKKEKLIPVSLNLPVVYVNQALLAEIGERPKEEYSSVSQLMEYDIALLPESGEGYSAVTVNKKYEDNIFSSIRISGESKQILSSDYYNINLFKNLKALSYLGMSGDLNDIQSTESLRGQYKIVPIYSEKIYADWGSAYSISADSSANQQKLAMYFLSYLTTTGSDGLPLSINELTEYVDSTALGFIIKQDSNGVSYMEKIKLAEEN